VDEFYINNFEFFNEGNKNQEFFLTGRRPSLLRVKATVFDG
jgi:hypothetical protein